MLVSVGLADVSDTYRCFTEMSEMSELSERNHEMPLTHFRFRSKCPKFAVRREARDMSLVVFIGFQ